MQALRHTLLHVRVSVFSPCCLLLLRNDQKCLFIRVEWARVTWIRVERVLSVAFRV